MKLIIDMNLSPRWMSLLTQAGFEAVHWSTIGAVSATDHEIAEYARVHGHVILTHDLDFGAILVTSGGDKPSVVQVRTGDVSPTAIGPTVVDALRQMEAQFDAGALLTIYPSRARLRLLPVLPPS